MRKNHIAVFVLLLAGLGACQKDEYDPEIMKGSLSINVGLFINVNEVENSLKSTNDAEDFVVVISNSAGEEIVTFERAGDMPETIELDPGEYYVTAHSDNNLPAAFENPYYYGQTDLFTITQGELQAVTVNCEMANTMVTIVYEESVQINYSDYSATVSSSAGSLTFGKDETRPGYFQPLPLSISVILTWQKSDGTIQHKTLTGTIPDPQPHKNYEIHVNASATEGSAAIEIGLDKSVGSTEIVTISDDGEIPANGTLGEGDLLITEIMYNPYALTDNDGEWFEIYNNTNQPIDLNQLVLRRNDNDVHIVNAQISLAPAEYYVFARTAEAVSVSAYVYGSDISLTNSGATLSLYNYGNDGSDGSLICSINYGGEGFPDATGASICLSPTRFSLTDAVNGESWCVSVTEYHSGDLGTPGSVNDNCP